MKYLLPLLLVTIGLNALAQKNLNNVRTSSHINLPGTRAYIVLPDGFNVNVAPQNNGQGVLHMIFAREDQGSDFYTVTKNFRFYTNNSFLSQLKYKQLTVNGYAAKLAVNLISSTLNYTLAFGDSNFCVTVTCILKEDDKAAGKLVEKAFETVYYDTSVTLNQLTAVPFVLDDSQGVFKFAEKAGNNYVYSVNGEKTINYDAVPSLTVYVLGYRPNPLHQPVDGVLNMMLRPVVKNVSEDKLNGYPSFKREVYGKVSGTDYMLFQQVVVLGTNTVVMVGVTTTDFDKYLAEFKKLASTLQKK